MTFRLTTMLVVAIASWLASPAEAQNAPANGEQLFRARCGTCHSLEPGQNRLGPSLAGGLVDREAGKVAGARYSEALRNSKLVWTAEQLDAYLENPRQVVPGTTMTFALRDAAQRQAIIAYLRGVRAASQ